MTYAKDVTVPTLLAQVHHDSSTHPSDVQDIYDNLGATDKHLHWIEGTTAGSTATTTSPRTHN